MVSERWARGVSTGERPREVDFAPPGATAGSPPGRHGPCAQAFELGYRLGGQSAATTRSGVLEVYGRGLRRLFTLRELCGIDLKGFEFWRWVLGRPWALGREARATFWALGGLWALGAIGRRRRGLRARYFERCLLRSF
jgi:hypothetical protein